MTDMILLTGATGFLGTEIARRLMEMPEIRISAVVRAADNEEACRRLKATWHHEAVLYKAVGVRILPVAGDFTEAGLGLSDETAEELRERITHVIHAGAEISFQKAKEAYGITNVRGTANMIAFSKTLPNLRRFVYISTAYTAGPKSGVVKEEDLPGTVFSNYYEESKAAAENLVRTSDLPWSVCRPGMVVGDSRTGWAKTFNTVYYLLKLMLLGKIRVLPVKKDRPLNLVPGDYVADSVTRICFHEAAEGKVFHLTCPDRMAPTAGELAAYTCRFAERQLDIKLPMPLFVPTDVLKKTGQKAAKTVSERKKGTVTNLLTLLLYFYSEQIFDRANTDRVCGPYSYKWQDYIEGLLVFACRKNFMRQTELSVFEQAMVRRSSTRYPIHYYDVAEKGMRCYSGAEANERIEKVYDALWACGIRSGDRVALTGINSVSYLVLEQAIGLLGAVSVPIYYTTPADETAMLLKKSGAGWFFVGDVRMMEQLETIETDVKIVSFSAGQRVKSERVMRFGAFLGMAKERAPRQHPDPEALATIRYTSGTTGEPKGVMFRFWQLKWMGEVLTNLLSFKDRNDKMCYLSFLPLSHVVEGILASYAPYFVLADVEYYYLNDFGKLTEALPKVRPNVFFSVPRFYEKVWDQAVSNRLGKAWLEAGEGPAKQAMGAVLKRAVLSKAGLDRCRQLIVGSAPVSEQLLLNYRKLGIEIYNAYGQTEAPLITINRLGDNVIPTIGTPLPDTTVEVAEDGELIVTGPQVAAGYYGLESETIGGGVLRTGDLGSVDEAGHITLYGRKKFMVITSYGKNISIPKIEERLKNIPGVAEAVLIGENRPYCTALLWLEGDIPDLAGQIEAMNESLSHPEQIRKWSVIDKSLSIQAGELTPNLKVKRANVAAHLAEEIEAMYR